MQIASIHSSILNEITVLFCTAGEILASYAQICPNGPRGKPTHGHKVSKSRVVVWDLNDLKLTDIMFISMEFNGRLALVRGQV